MSLWFNRESVEKNEDEKCWIPFELGQTWSSHAEGLHSDSSRFEVMYRVVGKKDQKADLEIASAEVDSRMEKFIAKHTPGRGTTALRLETFLLNTSFRAKFIVFQKIYLTNFIRH